MFSNPNGLSSMPRTFDGFEELWTPRRAKNGYYNIAGNTVLTFDTDHFVVTFWRTELVHVYRTHTALFSGGYGASPTTLGRINSFVNASVHNRSDLGYEQTVRVNGFPFFEGIRVLPNGQVFPEDIRSDFYTKPKKEIVQSYVALFAWIKKNLRLRFNLGEFTPNDWDGHLLDLAGLNQMRLTNEEFIPYQMVKALFFARDRGEFEECINVAREHYRSAFYTMFDGYERIEVKNENR